MNVLLAAFVIAASAITPLGFPAEPKVLLADGSHRAISQLRVGDRVRSTDPGTDLDTTSRVTRRDVLDESQGVDIATTAGSLVATNEARFWVEDLESWVDARRLRVGDRLRDIDGSRVTVTGVRASTKRVVAHQLTVEDVPAFYLAVGGRHVLADHRQRRSSPRSRAGDECVRPPTAR